MWVFETLRGLGYAGGYDAIWQYARGWQGARNAAEAAAFVPLGLALDEAYQFDRSHEAVLIGGTTVTVKAAHVRLCHSQTMFVRTYPHEIQEMVFDARSGLRIFRHACRRGIYVNMTIAVDVIFVGKERAYNRCFLPMYSHYLVDPVVCTPKGQVKNQVGLVAERRGLQKARVALTRPLARVLHRT